MIAVPIISLLGKDIGVLARKPFRLNYIALDPFVKQFRLGPLLRLAYRNFLRGDNPAHCAGWIVEVSGKDCLRRTDNHTSRFDLILYPVGTEVTFGGGVGVGVDIEGVVRAGLHGSFSAHTSPGVE